MLPATKILAIASLACMLLVPTPLLATDHTVLMSGDYEGPMTFNPVSLTIQAGDRVRWVNATQIQHTATSGTDCAPDGLFNTGILDPAESSAYVTFSTQGTVPYYCRFHCAMGMTGEITVTQPPLPARPSTWGRVKALFSSISR